MAAPKEILARDAYLGIVRLHEQWASEMNAMFKRYGLTMPQFNVLRILRGGPPEGLRSSIVGERLVNRLPDVTRLVDRMVRAGLVERERGEDDRRVVRVRLTPAGLELCNRLDAPVLEQHARQGERLTRAELAELARLSAKVVGAPAR